VRLLHGQASERALQEKQKIIERNLARQKKINLERDTKKTQGPAILNRGGPKVGGETPGVNGGNPVTFKLCRALQGFWGQRGTEKGRKIGGGKRPAAVERGLRPGRNGPGRDWETLVFLADDGPRKKGGGKGRRARIKGGKNTPCAIAGAVKGTKKAPPKPHPSPTDVLTRKH